jgi:hypothetical protein
MAHIYGLITNQSGDGKMNASVEAYMRNAYDTVAKSRAFRGKPMEQTFEQFVAECESRGNEEKRKRQG